MNSHESNTSGATKQHWEVIGIGDDLALRLIFKYHYSSVMPRHTKYYLGGYVDGRLSGVMTLGWGTQPKQTIQKLFPALDTKDYYEIGKLCLPDYMERNSESQFIAACIKYIKRNIPITLLYTWADGIVGKPGYVYQASNFLYGGYITTDIYVTEDGEKIHPRSTKRLLEENAEFEGSNKRLFWMTPDFMYHKGIWHYKGKQFRYLYPIDTHKWKSLKSTVSWTRVYPKHTDLVWRVQIDRGLYVEVGDAPIFNKNNYTTNKRNVHRSLKAIQNGGI